MTDTVRLHEIQHRLAIYEGVVSNTDAARDIRALLGLTRELREALRVMVKNAQDEWGEDAAEEARALLSRIEETPQ